MKQKLNIAIFGFAVAGFSTAVPAVSNAPVDADIVTLRKSCTVGITTIPNCFESMSAVGEWLTTVRHPETARPTLVDIGPGKFDGWACYSSDVTLRGSGRDRTILGIETGGTTAGIYIGEGCTNLSVQDLTVDNSEGNYGIKVTNPSAITKWTNVEIIGANYGWDERVLLSSFDCSTIQRGKHLWFSSQIRSIGLTHRSRAYSAHCAESWFWGSEITATVNDTSAVLVYAINAKDAEIHLYGSNVGITIPALKTAIGFNSPNGDYLIAATNGSEIHIHGSGLDLIHQGKGVADMLYADETSHFHANESGFNIHVAGAGQVRRLHGTGKIKAPYMWEESTTPPLSANGMQTLISRNGADRYIETDCPLVGKCTSLGGDFPHEMIYLTSCANTDADHGPWFDMTTKACRGE